MFQSWLKRKARSLPVIANDSDCWHERSPSLFNRVVCSLCSSLAVALALIAQKRLSERKRATGERHTTWKVDILATATLPQLHWQYSIHVHIVWSCLSPLLMLLLCLLWCGGSPRDFDALQVAFGTQSLTPRGARCQLEYKPRWIRPCSDSDLAATDMLKAAKPGPGCLQRAAGRRVPWSAGVCRYLLRTRSRHFRLHTFAVRVYSVFEEASGNETPDGQSLTGRCRRVL